MTDQNFQSLDSQFSAVNHLSCLGDFLSQLSNNSYFSVCVKDIKTNIIRMSNAVCNQLWGFAGNEMIGMTTQQVLTRIEDFRNVEEVLAKVAAVEKRVITSNQQVSYTETALVHGGSVKIRNLITIPIYGSNGRPMATISIGFDVTRNLNLLRLLEIYNVYYPKPKALSQFSEHLNLKQYFMKLLSFEELKVILAMVKDTRHKGVARILNLAPKTVSNYLYSAKDKLKPNIDFNMILSSLRDYQQWGFEL